MSAGTIREFLVLLGYKVDHGSEARFTRSIGAATLQAKLLGDAIESAAKAVHDAVAGIARDLEQLYFASKRTGAAVENIKAMQLALTQMGGSADGALGTLESIARFMRNNPAGEGFIRGLGVQTRGTNGALRDTSEIVTDLGKRLAAMPSYMANAYAGVLGIDERTLLALREGLGDYAETYHRFVAAAHIDQQKAASDSHAFMVAQRNAAAATSILFDKVAGQLSGPLAAQFDRFTTYLVAHYDRISRGLEAAGKVIIWFISAVTTGALRIGDALGALMGWFDGLDARTQRLVEAAAGLLVAWRLLSRGFMSTPLSLVIAGLTALLLLLEDYSGWKSGKRSLVDWSLFDGGIQKALGGFGEAAHAVSQLVEATIGWERALEAVAVLLAGSWLTRVVGAFRAARTAQAVAAATGAAGAGAGLGVGGSLLAGAGAWMAADAAADATKPEQAGLPNLLHNMMFDANPMHWTQSYGVGDRSAGGGAGAPSGGSRTGAAHAMQVLQGLGWSRDQAAGLAASVSAESGGRADKKGDSGLAYGALQWHPDRQANFAKWAGHDIRGSSIDEQLRFMDFELRRGTERAAGAALMAAHGAREAGMVVSSRYVRPRDRVGNMLSRGALADQFASAPIMGGAGGQATASSTTNAPVANMNTTIHVDGSHDPHATARAVAAQQQHVAQAATRNLRGVVS
jgi:hypothetical protein